MPKISISVVSHLQCSMVEKLLEDIEKYCKGYFIEVLLTINIHEGISFAGRDFSFPIKTIYNQGPQGFAANHNQAFTYASGQFFCVMNPDIRLNNDPFHALLSCLHDSSIGVAAPVVLGGNGEIEDSARHFPTPLKILCKAFGGCKGSDYVIGEEIVHPDWVGGMFMLFPRSVFETLGGFDQRYFLYYEDVDLCARLQLQGYKIALCPQAKVIHHAHRSSHRNLKYLKWHLVSMLSFFYSPVFWRVQCRKWV